MIEMENFHYIVKSSNVEKNVIILGDIYIGGKRPLETDNF